MEHASTPISFFCRNARLFLQKAAFARKSHMLPDELEHLRSFESLVSETIPDHPLFSAKRGEKEILELEFYLSDVRKRLAELEGDRMQSRSSSSANQNRKCRSKKEKDHLRSPAFSFDDSHSSQRMSWSAQDSKSNSSSRHRQSPSSSRKRFPASQDPSERSIRRSPSISRNSTPLPRSPSLRSASSGSTSSRKTKSRASARPRSSLQKYADEVGLPSPKTPTRHSEMVDEFSRWDIHGSGAREDTINTQMEGFVLRSEESENTEAPITSNSFYQEFSMQRLRNLAAATDEIPQEPSLFEVLHGTNAGATSHFRRSPCPRFTGGDTENLQNGFQDLGSALENFGSGKNRSTSGAANVPAKEHVAGLTLTENLEEALKRLGSLQDSDGSCEEIYSSANDDTTPSWPAAPCELEKPTKIQTVTSQAEVSACTSTSSRRALFGKQVSFQDERHLGRDESCVDQERSSRFEEMDGRFHGTTTSNLSVNNACGAQAGNHLNDYDCQPKAPGFRLQVDRHTTQENGPGLLRGDNWLAQGQSINKSMLESSHDEYRLCEDQPARARSIQDVEKHLEGEHEPWDRTEVGIPHIYGGKSTKIDHKKKVKFEGWKRERESENAMGKSSILNDKKTQSEVGALSGHFNTRTGDAASQLEKSQVKYFPGMEEHTQHYDDENIQRDLDNNPTCLMPNSSLLLQGTVTSAFSSSALCGDVPSFSSADNLRNLNLDGKPFSLGWLSPSGDSSFLNTLESQSFNFLSDDVDAPLYQHQMGASNPQHTTFCNPVFDFDSTLSNKAYPESISRPMFDTCDVDEERLESILGDCAFVAGQLQGSTGEHRRGSSGNHNQIQDDHGSLHSIHGLRDLPSFAAAAKSRHKDVHFDDCSRFSAKQVDSMHVMELEKMVDSFQKMVNELKESVQSSSTQIHEQVNLWQGRVKGVERELNIVKMEMSSELLGLKMLIKNEKEEKSTKEVDRRERSNKLVLDEKYSEEKMKVNLAECNLKIDTLKQQVDSWLTGSQEEMKKGIEEAVAESLKNFGGSLRTEIEKLELVRLRDFGNLKKEMALKFSIFESKEQLAKKTEKQLDVLVEEMLEKQFSHFVELVSAGKEKVISEMKNELAFLRQEVEALHKGRAEVQGHLEVMMRVAEEVRVKLGKGESLKDEDCMIKKQLQVILRDGMQVRFLLEGMKKETDAEVQHIRHALGKLNQEGTECRENIFSLKTLEESLSTEQTNLKKIVEAMEKERNETRVDMESLKKFKDELETDRSSLKSEIIGEGTVIMERVESLSQLYLGGLEEVRTDLLNFKLHCQDRLDDFERICKDAIKKSESWTQSSFLSSIETRIMALEKEHNCTQALENKAEAILTIVEKHRKLSSAAATDAAASAHKAEESLSELLSFISSEMNSTKKKSCKLQESLVSDRETSASLLLEMMTVSADLHKEKDVALAAASAANKKCHELVQDFENKLVKLKLDLSYVEKNKDYLSEMTAEVAGSAAKAKHALDEIREASRKSSELSNEALAEITQTKQKREELAQEVVAEMANIKRKSVELSQEVVAEMANTKRKSIELGQVVLEEIASTKRKGTQLEEAVTIEMGMLQAKADELLEDITRTKRKSAHVQEAAAAEAASWAVKAEELIAKITHANSKTLQCQETAAMEAAALANQAEEVLSEMMSMKEKCFQLHEGISEVIGNAKVVQEQCNKETNGWKRAMEWEIKKAKSLSDELEHIKLCAYNYSSEGDAVLKADFAQHASKTDLALKQLTETVKTLACDPSRIEVADRKCASEELGQIKQDIKQLNQRVETIASLLESTSHLNGKVGEQKVQTLLPECLHIGDKSPCLDLDKRTSSIEREQSNLAGQIVKVQERIEELEKSVAIWLPKYEAAARVLNEVESRLGVLETSAAFDGGNMYKDSTANNQDEGRWQPPEGERMLHCREAREKGVVKSFDARMIILESRIEHVASATYTNLRILDTKVEHINGSLETALESASMAEKKCSLLGAELVKVFRMLANLGKSCPAKPPSSKRNESHPWNFGLRFHKPETSSGRRKDPLPTPRTQGKKPFSRGETSAEVSRAKLPVYDNQRGVEHLGMDSVSQAKGKVNSKGDSLGHPLKTSHHKDTHAAQKGFRDSTESPSDVDAKTRKPYSMLRCKFETFEAQNPYHGTESNSTKSQSGHSKSVGKWDHDREIQKRRCAPDVQADIAVGSGKLGDTISKPVLKVHVKGHDVDQGKNASQLSPVKNSHKTDFHIDSGRIHVDVSHRSQMFT